MARTVGIGHQDFETVKKYDYFYVDKTYFIQKWWEEGDSVTLLTRPRRFGKTLNMSMLENFFSVEYAGREELFQGLSVWESESYRGLQGTFPVISLSFANIKEKDFQTTRKKICQIISDIFSRKRFLLEGDLMDVNERRFFMSVSADMDD